MNVFHFLFIIAHGLIQCNSLSEATYSLCKICGLEKINSNTWNWTIVLIWAYTQKSKYWTRYLFLLDITYKKYLIEPSHKNYLQLKVL